MKDIQEVYLYQDIKTLKGLQPEVIEQLGILESEIWDTEEIGIINKALKDQELGQYFQQLIWDKDDEVPEIMEIINLINYKRAYQYRDLDGEVQTIAIPKMREDEKEEVREGQLNYLSNLLFRAVSQHCEYLNTEESKKKEAYDKFQSSIFTIRTEILKRIASKRFKEKYRMKFNGFNSVALSHGFDIDGVMIPQSYSDKYDIKVGDWCIVKRDPLQNIFLLCKVIGFNKAPINRVHPIAFRMVDGDFDGDNVAVIPLKKFFEDNKEFIDTYQRLRIEEELKSAIPSKMIHDPRFKHLTREYSPSL